LSILLTVDPFDLDRAIRYEGGDRAYRRERWRQNSAHNSGRQGELSYRFFISFNNHTSHIALVHERREPVSQLVQVDFE
jgi:hypothetical protein